MNHRLKHAAKPLLEAAFSRLSEGHGNAASREDHVDFVCPRKTILLEHLSALSQSSELMFAFGRPENISSESNTSHDLLAKTFMPLETLWDNLYHVGGAAWLSQTMHLIALLPIADDWFVYTDCG